MKAYIGLNEHTKLATVSYDVDCLPPDVSSVRMANVPDSPAYLRMQEEARIAFTLMAHGYEVDYSSWELAQ